MRCARVEVTKRLDYQRAEIFAVETHSEIAVCAHGGDAIEQTPAPPSVIEKGLAAPGILAFVVIAKYLDHLPLYRIHRMLGRWGVPLPRSTLTGWIRQVAEALLPIYLEIRRQILLESFLQSDDTPVRVLREKGGPFTGRFWAWRGVGSGRVLFEFAESRSGQVPRDFLGDWTGRLQADAYAGYDAIYKTGLVVEFGCWAHARRKVFDALDSERQRAQALLALILQLFLIERDLEALGSGDRRTRRRELSQPVLDEIENLCADYARSVPPRTPLGVAVGYIQSNWKAFVRFVDDGEAAIHNNAIENAIRPLAIGRKNWLFAGSPEGGTRAAILFTLVENCRRLGIDPELYVKDVLERLPTHLNRLIDELTPHGWKAVRDRQAAETAARSNAAA
jgi:transposase